MSLPRANGEYGGAATRGALVRREVALELLAATGMDGRHYEPRLVRLLWRLGIDIPPPHFASSRVAAVMTGTVLSLVWSPCVWWLSWDDPKASWTRIAIVALLGGLLFGVAMALYYRSAARRYNLPPWESLAREQASVHRGAQRP